jgi:hypothetical protein
MEYAAPVALGVMLVISLLIVRHNARRAVIRKRWLMPLLGFGPVAIPLVVGIAYSGLLSSTSATALMFIGSGFCFAVWTATLLAYWVFWGTRDQVQSG